MITIGIPVWKQAQYLPAAIESALRQTTKCEIIVVNDGSPDNSLEVAKQYEMDGVRVINQVNKGLASARNTAIMNMHGDYFLPLDADDILHDTAAERIFAVAHETDADVIAPSFQEFGMSHNQIILMPNPQLADFRTFNRIGYFSAIKKTVLQEVGGYSPKMTWGWEDYHLWFNLLDRNKKFVTIPEVLVYYRTKPKEESMWQQSTDHSKELWDQIFTDFRHLFPDDVPIT